MNYTSTMQTKTNGRFLPKGWQWAKFGDIIAESQPGFASGQRDSSGVIQLRMNNVDTRGNLVWDNFLRVPAEDTAIARYSLKAGDIVFNNTNSTELVGKSALFLTHDEPVVYSNHFTRLRVKSDSANPGFVTFWLISQWQLKIFEKICNRWIGQSSVKNDKLFELEIPLPPLDEQRRIASRLNEQLAAVESARKAAEEQLHAAWQLPSAYLREVFESLFTKDTKKRRLGDFVTSYRNGFGKRPTGSEDGGVIVLRLADVTGGKINLETPRRGVMTDEELETYTVKNGDLLFVRVNGSKDLVGRCAIVQDLPEIVSYNDHLIRVRLNDEILPEYVKLVTDTHEVRNYIVEKASTSAGQLTINQEMLSSLEMPIFSLSEQKDLIRGYKEKITKSDTLIKILESQLAEIESLPASLLREAFAGGG